MRISRAVPRIVLSGFALVALVAALGRAQDNASGSAPLASNAEGSASGSCSKSLLFNFDVTRRNGEPGPQIPIWSIPGSSAFFYEAGMSIDADGAPNAYSPDNAGLDDLDNAGSPGDWWALAVDANGEPYIQGE